ncbi:hypothetical protein BMS3Bbin10_01616 [bacterium BMS3Bbin10]|nr:hypothetical protein BMS3Bbin10_01616 [bacterium BMS3Bbin10]
MTLGFTTPVISARPLCRGVVMQLWSFLGLASDVLFPEKTVAQSGSAVTPGGTVSCRSTSILRTPRDWFGLSTT